MDYFSLLQLQKEPFSNSPDPEMFFQSAQHQGCLQKLELAIRLKRGLSVVVGDIGTGKSTLCRQLIRVISQDNTQILSYLILDPEFTTPLEFLITICKTFGLDCHKAEQSEWQLKDIIKNQLLTQAIKNQKILVLIIDEGQKLPGFCVELLREFLNFETNQYKLLQIVIFAQEEFTATLRHKPNFADRITTYQHLQPLSFRETQAMIDFRLDKAHTQPGPPPKLFSFPAVIAIFCLTRGYPRRIVMLCSKVVIAILVSRDPRAGIIHVLRAARETSSARPSAAIRWRKVFAATALIAAMAAAIALATRNTPMPIKKAMPQHAAMAVQPAIMMPHPTAAMTAAEEETPPPITNATDQGNSPPGTSPQQPATLGSLTIEDGVSLSKMVARVYGRYSPKKLAMVLEANPQIADPNHLLVKTPIHFPVPPENEIPSAQSHRVYLELAQNSSLAEAYAIVKNHPETSPPLLIMPQKTANNGFFFHVVLEESFNDAQSASAKALSLPPQWRTIAKARNGSELTP